MVNEQKVSGRDKEEAISVRVLYVWPLKVAPYSIEKCPTFQDTLPCNEMCSDYI